MARLSLSETTIFVGRFNFLILIAYLLSYWQKFVFRYAYFDRNIQLLNQKVIRLIISYVAKQILNKVTNEMKHNITYLLIL